MSKDFDSQWLMRYERRRAKQNNSAGGEIPDTQQRQRKASLEADSPREAQGAGCPHVCFTLHRVRLLDVDAKYHSIKDLLDGLQHAGLIRGDKEGQITLEVKQVKVQHFAKECTVIEITNPNLL